MLILLQDGELGISSSLLAKPNQRNHACLVESKYKALLRNRSFYLKDRRLSSLKEQRG